MAAHKKQTIPKRRNKELKNTISLKKYVVLYVFLCTMYAV